ncbi:MAG: hypothetical protein ABI378_13635 [Chitinophagaceae bacterium]
MFQSKFVATVLGCILIVNSSFAQCPNSDVEYGNLSNWTAWSSINIGGVIDWMPASLSNPNGSVPGIVAGEHTPVTTGFDPVVGGTILPMVSTGNYAIRLGGTGNNMAGARTIAYSIPITSANSQLSFAYALVLQDPGHPAGYNPFFTYWVSKSNDIGTSKTQRNLVLNGIFPGTANHFKAADPNDPFFVNNNGLVYRNWTVQCLDLSGEIGQTVTIYFHVAGCGFANGAHYGYAYIDGLCTTNNIAQPSFSMVADLPCVQSILCDGSASKFVTDYFWKFEQIDCVTKMPILGTAKIQYFNNSPVRNIDALAMYRSLRGSFTSGC